MIASPPPTRRRRVAATLAFLQWVAGLACIAVAWWHSGGQGSPERPILEDSGGWLVGAAVLLGTLPISVIAAVAEARRDRQERLIASLEDAAGSERRLETPNEVGEELGPVVDSIRRLETAWFDRLARLEVRLEEQGGLLEALGSGLISLDRDQRVRSMNGAAAALLCLERDAAPGRLLQEIVRSAPLHRLLGRATSGAEPRPEEFALSIAGREVMVQATCSRVGAEGGSDRGGLLLLLTDVTRLRRLESLRSDFAANVSHELRTPITNIKGYVETLLEVGLDDQEQGRRFLDIVRRNADRLAAIIEDLLTLAQLEGPEARQRLEPATTDASRLVEAVVESLLPAAEARGITLDRRDVRSVRTTVNAALVEQALANLVSNAIKYSPEGSTVRLSTSSTADGGVRFCVRDEGPGIPAEHHERLFERFYRVDRARSRDRGGTGLGLSIVKHIAAVHDGRVEVESAPGAGSEFRLILPARPGLGEEVSERGRTGTTTT